jgi:hypothetical protein
MKKVYILFIAMMIFMILCIACMEYGCIVYAKYPCDAVCIGFCLLCTLLLVCTGALALFFLVEIEDCGKEKE